MRHGLLRLAGLLAAALLVAACQGSASPAPSSAAPAASSAAPAESVAASSTAPGESTTASESAAESPIPASLAIPSGFNQAPDLEAQLPSQVAGETLQKFSFQGSQVLAGSSQAPEIQGALGALGKSISDVSFAVAAGADVQIGAYRIAGTDANRVLQVVQQAMQSSGASAGPLTDANKGGKAVKVSTDAGGSPTYFYPHGDVLFFVTGKDDAKVTAALQALP